MRTLKINISYGQSSAKLPVIVCCVIVSFNCVIVCHRVTNKLTKNIEGLLRRQIFKYLNII